MAKSDKAKRETAELIALKGEILTEALERTHKMIDATIGDLTQPAPSHLSKFDTIIGDGGRLTIPRATMMLVGLKKGDAIRLEIQDSYSPREDQILKEIEGSPASIKRAKKKLANLARPS